MRHARFRQRPTTKVADFEFVAPAPELSGEPGIRLAECVHAQQLRRAGKCQVILTFETEEGEQGRLWCEVPERLTSGCRYMRLVALACRGVPQRGANIHPGTVFEGLRFKVRVGYRRTQNPKGAGKADDALAEKRKDERDFLRVIELLEVLA